MVSSERNVPTWPSKPSATAEESRKPVGTACTRQQKINESTLIGCTNLSTTADVINLSATAEGTLRRPKTQRKRPDVITTLFIIIGVFNAKGRRIAEVNREGAQRKFGMNMDREAGFFVGQLIFIFNYSR